MGESIFDDVTKLPLGLLVMALRGALFHKTKKEAFPLICEFKKRYKSINPKRYSNKVKKGSIIPASHREIVSGWLVIGKNSIVNAGYKW